MRTAPDKKRFIYFIAGCAFASSLLGVLVASGGFSRNISTSPQTWKGPELERSALADAKTPLPETSLLRKSSESFRAVAKTVGPAVVTIKSTIGVKKPRGGGPDIRRRGPNPAPGPDEDENQMEDPFFEFFRRFGQPNMPQEPQTSLGSGIIIDKKGYIVTNNHVVEGAGKVVVNLPGDESTDLAAKVIGTDPRTDLAVIKITTNKDLPTAQWADSDAVEVGDWALAIGSPFMLTHSVTLGIVSAKGRNASALMGADYGYEMLQTDAAINPGNSGGPLCTIEGTVMGVNSAIFTRSGGYMGIGFAIPSNLAKDIANTLIKGGKIVRGWLGVAIQPLDDGIKKDLGIQNGVLVHQITPNSPAEKAGLKPGDVLVDIAGKPVKEVSEVQHQVSAYKPGDKVKIKVIDYDNRKSRTVEVKIGELPAQTPETQEAPVEEASAPDKLGLMVSAGKEGVRIDRIEPGSIAEQVGLEKGDRILSINRHKLHTVGEYHAQMKASPRLNLLVNRKGQQLFFRITMPD